jgi:hypothetical protein
MKNRKTMQTGAVEHGGDSHLDFRTGFIMEATEQTGDFASVDLTRGIVDWHTHPATCKSKNMCTIGLPSPADLANVAIGATMGNQAHMVYSLEGTYVIQLDGLEIRKLLSDGQYARDRPDEVNRQMGKIFAKYSSLPPGERSADKPMSDISARDYYKRFSREYIRRAKELGFVVRLFPGDTIPKISISFACGNGGKELVMT